MILIFSLITQNKCILSARHFSVFRQQTLLETVLVTIKQTKTACEFFLHFNLYFYLVPCAFRSTMYIQHIRSAGQFVNFGKQHNPRCNIILYLVTVGERFF